MCSFGKCSESGLLVQYDFRAEWMSSGGMLTLLLGRNGTEMDHVCSCEDRSIEVRERCLYDHSTVVYQLTGLRDPEVRQRWQVRIRTRDLQKRGKLALIIPSHSLKSSKASFSASG